ncbi:hypothetical protein [Catenuloplanes atrovinosus]|uniref:Uncharacterized protein n=1 Tax=Catenuloplanes atrovinosus TaxID=137266 RepID=A0AAE4CC08_9ACTN|nr:hypothetical protein [Catenuloplanes atrovinosus]MDR7276090.1 hypothetical protein [Catenuloplanes atrovinosus]
MTDPGRTPVEHERRARASQSFWSMVVGVPAVFSVLRLGVEAGGELQTTLLLVANVDPINLMAALFTTATRFVSAGLVAVFAIGGVVLASRTPPAKPALFARWTESVPLWFIVAGFLLALITWQVLYLPLLVPCAAAAFQATPVLPAPTRGVVLAAAGLLLGYGWLVGPTVSAAAGQGEWLVVALFILPPLLAPAVPGPLSRRLTGPLAAGAQTVVLAMLVLAAVPVITTPVLPLTVTTITGTTAPPVTSPSGTAPPATPSGGAAPPATPSSGTAPPATPSSGAAPPATPSSGAAPSDVERSESEDVLGHVISVDDVSMVILQESGGVRYVPVDAVEAQVLCPTEGELPRHRLWVRGFHVEDSLLEGLGRQVRPVSRLDAACRNPVGGS